MPRCRIIILVGLLLAGSSRAQPPSEDAELPQPTQVAPEEVRAVPVALESPVGAPMLMAAPASEDWKYWVSADYAVAWLKRKVLPPLATTSPPGTDQTAAGVLPPVVLGSTSVLIGNSSISTSGRSQGRLDFGAWFTPERSLGVAGGFFVTESRGKAFAATSDGTTILARPFTDAATGTPSSVLVGFPGISSGSVNVFATSQTFWGAYFDLRENVISDSWWRLDSLFGYRYLHYGETLDMQESLSALGGAFVPGTTIVDKDSFRTWNDFNGCEFGFNTQLFSGRWSADLLTKLAVGSIRRVVAINGSTQTIVPGTDPVNGVGGVYALPSNIGTRSTATWALAPELGLTMGYQLSSNVHLHWGYSFLYLSQIARAADQIDFTLNQNLFPPAIAGGPNRPSPGVAKSDIWIQSILFGVEIRF